MKILAQAQLALTAAACLLAACGLLLAAFTVWIFAIEKAINLIGLSGGHHRLHL